MALRTSQLSQSSAIDRSFDQSLLESRCQVDTETTVKNCAKCGTQHEPGMGAPWTTWRWRRDSGERRTEQAKQFFKFYNLFEPISRWVSPQNMTNGRIPSRLLTNTRLTFKYIRLLRSLSLSVSSFCSSSNSTHLNYINWSTYLNLKYFSV